MTTTLNRKILDAVSRSDMSMRHVTIHPLDLGAWGCKEEAYCVHILTLKRDNPDAFHPWDRTCEDQEDKRRAETLADSIEALGKIGDRELHGCSNYYTRQIYVGDTPDE